MKNLPASRSSLNPRILAASAASLLAIVAASPSAWAGSLFYAGAPITENFDLLEIAGLTTATLTGNPTSDGTTPWFAGIVTSGLTTGTVTTTDLNAVSTGSVAVNTTTRLFNNGEAGINPLSDRALGSGNTAGNPVFDLSIVNNSASALGSFSITFDTEFWRGAPTATPTQTFGYQLLYSPTGEFNSWTPFTGAQITHPGFANAADLDGNAPENRVAGTMRSLSLVTPIPAGQTFFIRFSDSNDPVSSPDANIALDNFSFTATPVAPSLVYNLAHTVGGAPNGVLEISPAPYWLNGATPTGFNANDNLSLSQNGTATISVPASVTAGTISVSNTSGLYTLETAAGATLTALSLTGTAPLAKTGPGTLAFTALGSATGGLAILGGTVSLVNSSGVGGATQSVTLSNNASLQFTETGAAESIFNDAGTTTRTISVGPGGATIDVLGTTGATASGVTLNRPNSVLGSAPITKAGGGVLRLGANQTLLTSPWIVNAGALEASTAGALGPGSVTVNSGGALIALGSVSGLVLPNHITLAGGALGTKSGNSAVFGGSVNVTAPSTFRVRSNSSPGFGQGFAISGPLTGSGALTLLGPTLPSSNPFAVASLTNTANTYTGNITVSSLVTLASAPAGGVGSTLGMAGVTLAGGTLAIRDNGSGSNSVLAYGNDLSVTAPSEPSQGFGVLSLDRAATGATTGNTVAFDALSLGPETLVVTGANGYKARFDGPVTLTGSATIDTNTDVTLAGTASGSFSLTKIGAGRLLITGVNNIAGPTIVNSGVFGGNGSLFGSVIVNSGGTLAPGNSAGILSIGTNLTLASGAFLAVELAHGAGPAPIAGLDYDQVSVGTVNPGIVSLEGSQILLTIGTGIQVNDIFFVALNDGADVINGTFANAPGGMVTSGGQTFRVSYTANQETGAFTGGNDIALLAVPEPASFLLALLGGAGLLAPRRRRR